MTASRIVGTHRAISHQVRQCFVLLESTHIRGYVSPGQHLGYTGTGTRTCSHTGAISVAICAVEPCDEADLSERLGRQLPYSGLYVRLEGCD